MPRLPYSRGALGMIAVSAAFTAFGGFLLLTRGELLAPTLFFGACTIIALLSPLIERRVRRAEQDVVEFDDIGIRRRAPSGTVESITWDELAAIDIVTTDAGPHAEDVFWLLSNRDQSRGCAVPAGAEGNQALLTRLQALPGFDNGAVIQAMGSTSNARFAVWRRSS